VKSTDNASYVNPALKAGLSQKRIEQLEAGEKPGILPATVRARRSELVAGGWIEDSGRERTTPIGTKRTLWRATRRTA
jgi:hypothetical protein